MGQWPSRAGSDARHRANARASYLRLLAAASRDAESLDEVVAAGQRLARLGIETDLVGMPRGTAVELVDQWEALAEKYPEAAERWHSVGPDVDASRLQAGDFLGYRDGVMLWNHLQMRRQTERLVEIAADSVANGTHPAGCGTLAAMATHEFGHAVEDVVRERLGEGEWRGLTDRLVDCCISGYTAQKTEECFAVAFAALHHGTMLTAGAKRAVSIVSEVLKSVGM